jgi:hypothetical protein
MFVVQFSFLVIFPSLVSRSLSLMQTPKKSTHTLALRHVSACGVSSSLTSSYVTCWVLVHAYATSPGKAEWRSGLQYTIKMLHFVLFYSVTCYIDSIVSHIHVDTTKTCNVTRTLVATCVILWSWECSDKGLRWDTWIKWSEVCADVDRFVVFFLPVHSCSPFSFEFCVVNNWIVLGNLQRSIDQKP